MQVDGACEEVGPIGQGGGGRIGDEADKCESSRSIHRKDTANQRTGARLERAGGW